MSSRVQGFDSTLFRVVGSGQGDPGPLSADYLFGLGADPFNDNNFPMPGGNWRWPGNTDWGTGRLGAASAFFQNRVINMSEPPADHLAVMAMNLSGIGGNGCGAFDNLYLQDPLWSGSFGALANMSWVRETVGASSSILQTSGFAGTEYARRTYDPNGGSPFVPGLGQVGACMVATLTEWNNTLGAQDTVQTVSGYGAVERRLFAVQNGPSSQWVTHWLNETLVPAAGDGPAWFVDVDGRFGRFAPAAGLQAYQRTTSVGSSWGWKLWGTDSGFVLHDMLDVTTDGGTLNGATIATTLNAPATYASGLTDLTVPGNFAMNIPQRAGFVFMPMLGRLLLHAYAGTATGSLVISGGNDGAQTNIFNNTIPAGTLNTDGAAVPFPTTLTVPGAVTPLIDSNTLIVGKITTAPTGVTSAHGYVVISGFWLPT